MANDHHTPGNNPAQDQPQYGELTEIYDALCEQWALLQFYYEASQGMALLYHWPSPIRHGQSLFIGWLQEQQLGLKSGLSGIWRRNIDLITFFQKSQSTWL